MPRPSGPPRHWLTEEQRNRVDHVAITLPADQRHRFRLRVSKSLKLNGAMGAVTEAMLHAVIEEVLGGPAPRLEEEHTR